MKRSFWGPVLLLVVALIVVEWLNRDAPSTFEERPRSESAQDAGTRTSSSSVASAWAARRSDVMVEGTGVAFKLLPDDLEGSRHQKFLLRTDDSHTILVSHNIDLAPRVPLSEAQRVDFKGEYVWNDKGGLIHWTHHDPAGRHPGGWLELNGKRYE